MTVLDQNDEATREDVARRAAEAVDSGAARGTLERLQALTAELAPA